MPLKLLVLLYLLQVASAFDPAYLKEILGPHDLDHCNETLCAPPCPGAIPPKQCPVNVPYCHFGCACHTDCDVGITYCFQIKDCIEGRRLFAKRRRVTKY